MGVQEGLLEEVTSKLKSDGWVGIRWVKLEACRRLVMRGGEGVGTEDSTFSYKENQPGGWAEPLFVVCNSFSASLLCFLVVLTTMTSSFYLKNC